MISPRFVCNGKQRLQVVKTEGRAIAPRARLILEWTREGRCEERSLLADILPDRGMLPQRSVWVGFLLLVAILFPPLFEMKLALSRKEESQCTFQGGNRGKGRRRRAEEEEAAGVTVKLRVVRLGGDSRSA